ncbi:Rho GTPase activation protein [Schizopora paradoxa]|uniref:Rho GTPase activation protein n=1 Tax=Schizopora paradoxa TaxID=27342 RepID=A0A0H2RDX6_9AGAM|nr:Rho GTPase activation protein [Schizopora paradoxa]
MTRDTSHFPPAYGQSGTQQPPPTSPPNKANLKAWWKQFTAQRGMKKDIPNYPRKVDTSPHPVFGVPLRESLLYASVQISTANVDGQLYVWGDIPVVVAKCGLYLKENATEIEGTFRVSGSTKRMRDLQALFESPPRYGKNLDWSKEFYTPHDVASVFRRYLTQLPEPVIPTSLYAKFREPLAKNRPIDEVRNSYRLLIRSMAPQNQYLLLYVLDLLSVFSRKSDKNLMTASNLAVIFRPGLLSHPNHELSPEEHKLSQKVLEFLIEHQDWFMLDVPPPPPPRNSTLPSPHQPVQQQSRGHAGVVPHSYPGQIRESEIFEGEEVAAFPSDRNGRGHVRVLSDAASGWKLVERAQPAFASASGGSAAMGGSGKVGRRRSSSASGGVPPSPGPSGSGSGFGSGTATVNRSGSVGAGSVSRSRTLPSSRVSKEPASSHANASPEVHHESPSGSGALSRETSTGTASAHGSRNVLKKLKRTSLPPPPPVGGGTRSASTPSGHGHGHGHDVTTPPS